MPSEEKSLRKSMSPSFEKLSDTSEKVAETQRVMISFLEAVQEESRKVEARLGTPAFDFNRVLTNLKYAQGPYAVESVPALFDIAFEDGVPPNMLREMSNGLKVEFPGGHTLETYITERFFGERVVSDAHPDFRIDRDQRVGGGKEWLSSLVRQQFDADKIDIETAHQIQKLGHDISLTHGGASAAVARLMFMCSRHETGINGKREDMPRALKRFRLMVEARTIEKPVKEHNAVNFFEQMQGFFGVYADITTKVLRHAKKDQKEKIEAQSKNVLSRFLQSEWLRVGNIDHDAQALDPFENFAKMLRDTRENPWVLGDARETPFDISKFHRLITKDVPRGLVADAAFFLENYKESLFIQDIHQLLEEVENYHEKRASSASQKTGIPKQLEKKIYDAIDKVAVLEGKKEGLLDHGTRMRHLEDFASRQSRSLSAFSVLLRIVDPEKVVKNTNAKEEFNALVAGVGDLGDPEVDPRKMQILASSVHAYLKNTDPYLDVPLLGIEGDPSIRTLLTMKSETKWFDEKVLAKGPYAYSRDPQKPPEEPLITPRDLLGLSEEDIQKARMNFNTAKGATWTLERTWINNAGDTMSRLPNSYKNILRFARSEADFHWRNAGDYVTAFHPSASEAMADIVRSLFPPITNQDYIITTHQEYDSMTAPFIEAGAAVFAVHCNIRGENGQPGRPKSPEEIFEEISSIIERERRLRDGRDPLIFLASSKTRLGDATGVVPIEMQVRKRKGEDREVEVGERTPSSLGLAAINKMIEQKYSAVKTITDSSQSLGRNDKSEDMSEPSCDVRIASGGKALGIRNVAVTMIRKTPDPKPHDQGMPNETSTERDYIQVGSETPEAYWKRIWRDPLSRLTPGKGTIDTGRIAAFGIALQHLNSNVDTWGMRKPGGDKKQTQREMVAEHNRYLTSHMISKAGGYAFQLLSRLRNSNIPFPISDPATLANDPVFRNQFGCRVIYPVHRKKVDYTFATLTFPNLGSVERKNVSVRGGTAEREVPVRSNYLQRSLEKLGIPAEQCMLGGNGMRFSFNNLQSESDIDALFDSIVNIHAGFLIREIEKSKKEAEDTGDFGRSIKDLAELMARTPAVDDKEWVED